MIVRAFFVIGGPSSFVARLESVDAPILPPPAPGVKRATTSGRDVLLGYNLSLTIRATLDRNPDLEHADQQAAGQGDEELRREVHKHVN
jgi:hypothetical protein